MKKKTIANFIYTSAEYIGWLFGAIIMITEGVQYGLDFDLFAENIAFQVGFSLFIAASIWAVFKAKKEASDANNKPEIAKPKEEKPSSTSQNIEVETKNQSGGVAIGNAEKVEINYSEGSKKKPLKN
jgi:hypothetical protein